MTGGLLAAATVESASAFTARLVARARALGEARAAALLLARRSKRASRWRDARLLWPLFGKDA